MLKICLNGAGGRMGRAVAAAAQARDDCRIVAALESPGSSLLGADLGELCGLGTSGVALADDPVAAIALADVVIDFSRAEGMDALLGALAGHPTALVTGTTGLNPGQLQQLKDLASTHAIIQAANFSIGVTLCLRLSELAARVLDQHADVEILEAHHRAKVDAPSGTALRLGEAVAAATGRTLAEHGVMSREGQIGPRPERAIGFATLRAGDIVGEHTVLFAAPGERVEITHRASSRQNFASGALTAAFWLHDRRPGWYSMNEVLGLDAQLAAGS